MDQSVQPRLTPRTGPDLRAADEVAFAYDADDAIVAVHDRQGADPAFDHELRRVLHSGVQSDRRYRAGHDVACLQRARHSAVNEAAVDERRLAGHVIRVGTGQESNEARNILRRLRPAERDAFDILFVGRSGRGAGDLGKTLVDLDPHVGTNDSGAIGVHRDAMAGDGGGADDLALLLTLHELPSRGLNTPQHALHVDLEDPGDFLGRDVCQGFHLSDAGIVHHHVEAAELFLSMFDGCATSSRLPTSALKVVALRPIFLTSAATAPIFSSLRSTTAM